MSGVVKVATAEAHEALVTRLTRLLKQAESIAARRAQEPVSAAVARIAADLLFEAGRLGGAGRGAGLPLAAPDYPGLAAQLGQALATLEAFEVRHTVWDKRLKAFAWRVEGGKVRPVARLRQPLADPPQPGREVHDIRARLHRLLDARYEERYEAGFAAGKAAQDEPPPGALAEGEEPPVPSPLRGEGSKAKAEGL